MKKVLAFLLVAVCMCGCGASNSGKKVLKVGTNAAFAPFEFVADNEKGLVDKFDGVDIALAKTIAESNGYELEVVEMDFDSLGIALETGKVDFVAAGMTITEERAKTVDFSMEYYQAVQNIIIREDSKDTIKSAADLNGKNVGVQIATTGDFVCSDLEGVTVTSYKKGADAILALNNKQVDAVVIDFEPAKKFVKVYDGLLLVEDKEVFEKENYGMCVKKGNKEMLDKINAVLEKYVSQGKVAELVTKYS